MPHQNWDWKTQEQSPVSSLECIFAFAVTQHFGSRTATGFIIKFQVAGTDRKDCKDVDILTFHLRIFHLKPNLFLIYII